MILNDAEEEIEAILRGIIGVLEAWSPTKQTGQKKNKNLMQYVLNYLNNFCRVPHNAGVKRELR